VEGGSSCVFEVVEEMETWDQIIQILIRSNSKPNVGYLRGMHKYRSMPYRSVGGGSVVARPKVRLNQQSGESILNEKLWTGIDCRFEIAMLRTSLKRWQAHTIAASHAIRRQIPHSKYSRTFPAPPLSPRYQMILTSPRPRSRNPPRNILNRPPHPRSIL
jgi:hypothetical protein